MFDLAEKKMPELRAIAKKLNLPGVKAETAQSLRTRISVAMNPGVLDTLMEPGTDRKLRAVQSPVFQKYTNTPEAIMAALEHLKGRGLQVAFDHNERTWAVKKDVAQDSGTWDMPIDVIVRKATEIARARFPAKVRIDGEEMLAG